MPSDANESVTSSQSISLGLFGAAIAVSAWGSSGVIVKALDLDPVAISFYRFTVYSLAIFLDTASRQQAHAEGSQTFRAGGISLGIDVVLFFTAVKTTTIVNATTIGALQPIIVLSIATRFFGERVRLREIIAACCDRWCCRRHHPVVGKPEWNGAGDLAALGALDRHIVMSKRSAGVLTSTEYTLGTGFWTALVALPVGFVAGQDMSIPNVNQWAVPGASHGRWIIWPLADELVSDHIPLWIGSTLLADPDRLITHRLDRPRRSAHCNSTCATDSSSSPSPSLSPRSATPPRHRLQRLR